MIDLHCHSKFSDGELSPTELLAKAQTQGLQCLSLTDHDTLAGYDQLNQAAANTAITILPGIEISTRWRKYDIHILGYQIQESSALNTLIDAQKNKRIQRAQQIGFLLESIGISNAYDKACALAGHLGVARPHFAKILIQEGKTRDMRSAFKQYLGAGKIAYVPTAWVSLIDAVQGINEAGGQAVIAHPLKYGLTRSKLHELIKDFREAGGEGIEVVSGDLTVTQIKEMAATSVRFNLLASSGSDYHGDNLSRISLGRQPQLPENCTPIWHNWKF